MARLVYTDEHVEYVKSIYKGRYNAEITEMFNEKFNMNITKSALSSLKTRHKLDSGVNRSKRYYKDYEIEYLKSIAKGRSNKDLADMFNEKFGTDRTAGSIASAKFKNDIMSYDDLPEPYTEEQLNYLRSIVKGRSSNEIREMFNKRFNDNRTVAGIKSIRHKEGILTGNDGRFEVGDRPPNWVPLGTYRVTSDGYPEVKVKDGCYQENWKGRHIVEWEKINGPLSEGHVVIFGDGDKTNLNIDNLICISRKQLLGLNRYDLIQNDAELTRTAINIVNLTYKISELSKED